MSLGCGTLAGPGAFARGNAAASSSNGRQHSLPANPGEHRRINVEDVETFWATKQGKSPTRLWGKDQVTAYGGLQRIDGSPHMWLSGEFWNLDSNIRVWGEHEVRRNGAAANHDVHRHDQISRTYLPSKGDGRNPLQTIDLEAWGFDLGSRDRQGKIVPKDDRPRWQPVTSSEQFRAERSFNRDLERITNYQRTLRKSASTPGTLNQAVTLMPEDIGGEAGAHTTPAEQTLEKNGKTHGSRSCRGWDRYDHAVKREGAKMAYGVHAPSLRASPEAYPFKDNEMTPASIYTKRFKKGGEQALRMYEPRNERLPMK